MALITLEGTIKNLEGDFYASGTISFQLDDYFVTADGIVVPKEVKSAALDADDGTFSIILQSTADGAPSTRQYSVTLSVPTGTWELGRIQIPSTPSTQNLADLLNFTAGYNPVYNIIAPSYATADLPAVSAGKVAWRTDGQKGLLVGTDTQWTDVLPFYNVKTFGAKGDNSTDDSTALQAAIDAAVNGGIVFFPAGNYKFGTGLVLTKNVSLVGVGGYSGTVLTYSGTGDALTFDDTVGTLSRAAHKHFKLTTSTGANGFILTSGNHLTMENICITGFSNAGLRLYIPAADHVIVGNVYKDCNFDSNAIGVEMAAAGAYNEHITTQTFIGCRFRLNTSYGLRASCGVMGISLLSCIVEQSGVDGVRVDQVDGLTLLSSWFEGNDVYQIRIGDVASAAALGQGIIIHGCFITMSGTESAIRLGSSLALCSGVSVAANHIFGGTNGIDMIGVVKGQIGPNYYHGGPTNPLVNADSANASSVIIMGDAGVGLQVKMVAADRALEIVGGIDGDQFRIGHGTYYYKVGRNTTTGMLDFAGNQTGYIGLNFNVEKLGFHGTAPVAQQALDAAPTTTQISTVLHNLGLVS